GSLSGTSLAGATWTAKNASSVNLPSGTYDVRLTVTDTKGVSGGCTTPVTVSSEPDFSVNIVESAIATTEGVNGSFSVNLRDGSSDWTVAVPLSCTVSPAGPVCNLNKLSEIPSITALTTGTISNTAGNSGAYTITVTAGPSTQSGYTRTHADSAGLTIGNGPDFTMTVAPATASVDKGQGSSYTISYVSVNGWSTALSPTCLVLGSLLNKPTCSLSPASITPTGTQTLTVTTALATPSGTYTITVTATGTQSITRTHTVSPQITVLAPISCSVSPLTFSVITGQTYSSLTGTVLGNVLGVVQYSWGALGQFSNATGAVTNWTAKNSFGANLAIGSYGLQLTVTDSVRPIRTSTCPTTATVVAVTGSISGTVYYQPDQTSCSTSGASSFSGAPVTLVPASGSTQITTSNPSYSFSNLPLGDYTVSLTPPAEKTVTSSCGGLARAVTLTDGSNKTVDFVLNDLVPAPWFQVYGGDVNVNGQTAMDDLPPNKYFYATANNVSTIVGSFTNIGSQAFGVLTTQSFSGSTPDDLFVPSSSTGWSIFGSGAKPISFPALFDPNKSFGLLEDSATATSNIGDLSKGGIYKPTSSVSSLGNSLKNYKINGTNPAVAVILFNGDLTINERINKSSSSSSNTTLILVINGNLVVSKDVDLIEATVIVVGNNTTIVDGETGANDGRDKTLTISGGLYSSGDILINRDMSKVPGNGNLDPVLLVIYDPSPLVLSSQRELKEFKTSWVEIRN
ncbi:MAG: hypothetical protein ABII16_00730, partial [Patescibacteria group bacterium]